MNNEKIEQNEITIPENLNEYKTTENLENNHNKIENKDENIYNCNEQKDESERIQYESINKANPQNENHTATSEGNEFKNIEEVHSLEYDKNIFEDRINLNNKEKEYERKFDSQKEENIKQEINGEASNKNKEDRIKEKIGQINSAKNALINEKAYIDGDLENKPNCSVNINVKKNENTNSDFSHADNKKEQSNELPKLEIIRGENKDEDLEELGLKNLLDLIKKMKEEGNNYFKKQEWSKAEECYRKGVDEFENFFQENTQNAAKYSLKYPILLDQINQQRKFLFSNLGNSLQKQQKHFEVIQIDTFIIAAIDAYFDKSYIRLITSAIELKNFDLAQQYETIFKSRFDQKTIDNYKDYFNNLDMKLKEEKEKKEKDIKHDIKENFKKPNSESLLTPTVNNNSNLSQDSVGTNASKNEPKVQKVSKRYKFKSRFLLFSFMFVGGCVSLYFLISRRYYVKK